MLDENLPAFFFKKSSQGTAHHEAIYLAYQGEDPAPAYILKHADPEKAASSNCYAAALFDSFNPDVLYGEILVQPTWTQPSLSQEEVRKHGGVAPPPQANLPDAFTIQLYEPDQQVTVTRKFGNFGMTTSYEFNMPQTTFRTPSVSALDRTQSDPSAILSTPKLNFVWRKESKLSKDLTCFLTGKSTDIMTKKKNRDPDIAIALLRSLREVTIYEPNLSRVELEDLKGLEVVVLLAAAAIRDIYFSSNPAEIFNIKAVPPTRKLSSGGRKVVPTASPPPSGRIPTTVHPDIDKYLKSSSKAQAGPQNTGKDPRAQWEIDTETARLKAQVATEEKEAKRLAAQRKLERQKADEAETRRLKKMVDAEQKEAERQQKAVDEETARLRKKYGGNLPQLPTRPGPPPSQQGKPVRPSSSGRPGSSGARQSQPGYGVPLMMSGAAGPSAPQPPQPPRWSFFGMGGGAGGGNEEPRRVSKKKSSFW